MKFVLGPLFILFAFSAVAQINLQDSSVQVIGYWSKKDKQSYKIVESKYTVKEGDTSAVETITYRVDVTVLDSTAKSYTIQWLYKDYQISDTNELIRSIASIFKDIKVVIKTNEMGAFQEVVNWKEVRDEIGKATTAIKKKLKGNKEVEATMDNLKNSFSTKEGIEASAIEDITQFYTFHGGKYVLNEDIETKLVSNEIPEVPVNGLLTVRLTDINADEGNSIVRYWKEFDKKETTDAAYFFMKNSGLPLANVIPRNQMPEVSYEETVASRVHESGWILFSAYTQQTINGKEVTIEERQIEILE